MPDFLDPGFRRDDDRRRDDEASIRPDDFLGPGLRRDDEDTMPKSFALTAHASTPTDVVEAVAVRVTRGADNVLTLTYSLDGQLDRLRIPPVESPQMGSLLWQHTCFEAFIRNDSGPAYHELNLSPSTAWTVHAFRDYRDGGPLNDATLAPRITVRHIPKRVELEAAIQLDRLSPTYARREVRLALAAVIELSDGRLTYWSLHHAPGKPDFHHPSGFTVRLDAHGA